MFTLFFHWFLLLMSSFYHPFYISMTEVNYNKRNNTLEISVRIFTEDLEKAIRKTYKGKVDLMNKNEKITSEKLLKSYIPAHLSFKADGKFLAPGFVGYEAVDGSIWSYFEVPGITSLGALELTDDLLYECQEQQINFIHVKANQTDQTIKLSYPDTSQNFVLK